MNPTRPYEYGRALHKIMEEDPSLTIKLIADKFKQKADWVADRLTLAELHHVIGNLVDEKEIPISNALILAEFSPLQQLYLRTDAMSMQGADFKARCHRMQEWIAANPDYDGTTPFEGERCSPEPILPATEESTSIAVETSGEPLSA
jgi:hypothetical protein